MVASLRKLGLSRAMLLRSPVLTKLHGFGFAGALALCMAAPALGQVPDESADADETVWDRNCGDDSGTDRCDAEVQAGMRALYGWESAEALLEQRVQFRRLMMVDGYGRDVLGLSFERPPGASPKVVVEVPVDPERPAMTDPSAPLTAILSEDRWNEVLALTRHFDEQLAREVAKEESKGGRITICLHSWVAVMEAGDPKLTGREDAKLRADTEDACVNGLTMAASFQLADLAFEALPECQSLRLEDYRNRFMLLNHCKRLGGDRIAAAGVGSLVDKLDEWERNPDATKVEWLFAAGSRGDAERFAETLAGWNVYWQAPHAQDQHHATLSGWMSRDAGETDNSITTENATITLSLQGGGRSWNIASFAMSETETHTTNFDD